MKIETWHVVALGLGIVGVLSLGIGAAMITPDEADLPGELTKQRKRLQTFFSVAEDCSLIEFEGETQDFNDAMAAYVVQAVPVGRAQGLTTVDKLAQFSLQLLFPQCVWPPPGGFKRPDLSILMLVTKKFVKEVPA